MIYVIPFLRIRSTETVSCPPWNKLAICHFVLLHEAAEALQHTLQESLFSLKVGKAAKSYIPKKPNMSRKKASFKKKYLFSHYFLGDIR